jgi:hypothetical protein
MMKRFWAVAASVTLAALTHLVAAGSTGTNGPFKFVNLANGRCMEVYGWYKHDGAAVNRWDCHGGANQSWYVDPLPNSLNHIRGLDSGKCLQSQSGPGYGLQIATCTGAANQTWRGWPRAQGWSMENVAFPGNCLETFYGGDNGRGLTIGRCDAAQRRQQWEMRVPTDLWTIPAAPMFAASYGGKCLEVYGWSMEVGASVNQWDCHGGANQRWYVQRYTDDGQGVSVVWNQHSGMCLAAGNPSLGYTGYQERCTGLWAQRWLVTGQSSSVGITTYTFQSAYYPDTCLSVHLDTWNTQNGAGVYTFPCTSGDQRSLQRWVLRA